MSEKYTMTPPTAPIIRAAPAVGALGAAVIATNPAIAPFIAIVISIFFVTTWLVIKVATTPPAAAILVFKKT
jgi:hypothetical protein